MAPYVKKMGAVSRIVRDTYKVDGKISGWFEIANQVRVRANFTCQGCPTFLGPGRGDVHHIVPLSRGGTTTLRNLMLLCGDCHQRRHPDHSIARKKETNPFKQPYPKPKNPFGRRRP